MFVLDSSGSVGSQNWNILRHFTNNIMTTIYRDALFGVVSFGSYGYLSISLGNYSSETELHEKVSHLPWKRESSNIAWGIRAARKELVAKAAVKYYTGDQTLVLITDGPATAYKYETLPQAKAAKEAGIRMLVIAVTKSAHISDVRVLASDPKAKNIVQVNNFSNLLNIHTDVSRAILNNIGVDLSSSTSHTTATSLAPPTSIPHTTPPLLHQWTCSFETTDRRPTLCGMNHDESGDFDWSVTDKATPSWPTGPDVAHSSSHFAFIEATDRNIGDKARLILPRFQWQGLHCLNFWYHMFGFHIDTLQIILKPAEREPYTVWSRTGDKGNHWLSAAVNIMMTKQTLIIIEASRGRGFSGDIGLDTISFTQGGCAN